jgi:VWFA-related protein
VRDKNAPVEGLKKEDFQIFDHGKEQKIAVFTVASTKAAAAAMAKLPPGIYTNRPERGGEPIGSVTVVLIDLLNTRFQDQAYARTQMMNFLKTLDPQDRVALYLLGNGVKILHDFTQDPERLVRAVAKMRGEVPRELAAADEPPADTGDAELDAILNQALGQMQDFFTVNRVKTTLNAMEAIGNHLARLPGRKNLVWVSGSFPFSIGIDDNIMDPSREHRTFNDEAERASRALNNANVSIYPVDARGLIGLPASMTASSGMRVNTKAAPKMVSMMPDGHDTMQILAERTGGRAFYNTNDIRGALRKALEDAEVTYTLGYYPSSGDLDNKYHELKVKVDRKGVDVRHRKGYFASEEKPPTQEQMNETMRSTLAGGLDATGITLSARVDAIEKPQALVQLAVAVDLSTIPLEHDKDRWTGKVEFAVVQLDDNGKQLAADASAVNLNLKEDTYRQALTSGVVLRKNMLPQAGAKRIRVVILDRGSGRLGSLSMPMPKPPKA